jgi:hypothetical protein
MSESRAEPAQQVLNMVVRTVLGVSNNNSTTAADTICREFGIDSVYAMASAARTRGRIKYPELSTTISTLLSNVCVCQPRTWVTKSNSWINSHCVQVLTMSPAEAHVEVKTTLAIVLRDKSKLVTFKQHVNYNFIRTSILLRNTAIRYPCLNRGFHWLTRFRVSAFWDARRLAKIGYLPHRYKNICPCCKTRLERGETMAHFILECSKFEVQRMVFNFQDGAINSLIKLLGGSHTIGGVVYEINLDEWCPQVGVFHHQLLMQTGHHNGDENNWPGSVRTACFLQQAIPIRTGIIKPLLMNVPRAEATRGRAILQELFG